MIHLLVSCAGHARRAASRPASVLALLTGVAIAVPAIAATTTPDVPVDDPLATSPRRVGDATTGLLALQRSGRVATPVAQPISGEVASRSYQRYLKSFEHPIPEKLGVTGGGSGSAGGSDSGGTR